ncbi:acetyltransferase (GNAT) family protein [Chitinophaga niastensis]|uniref:Acetyltransferase (GNAT) family protein n=1 Tax=Chitinophaga niastensis TaxID=536980 RepID=A0A2P8HVN8_CHINA|nr:GNAT family N-acetyltransferase [Chitinophaga niastensis]PSL50303.1 acetyltransferase (GNAT) family protein [Chitinophaga niastensis]
MPEYKMLTATTNDAQELVLLINSAYRGEHSKKGWTTEALLIEGDRMNVASLIQMMNKPGVVIRKCITNEDVIVGCVYLETKQKELYLGLLTVSPDIQATGIGKMMLMDAEEIASKQNLAGIVIDVISLRLELIDWYIRRGFHLTDKTIPFPIEKKFGRPLQPLELVELKKYFK